MHVRLYEKGIKDPDGLLDYDTDLIPLVGDLIALEGDNQPRSIYEVTERMFRVSRIAERGDDATFYVAIEVKERDYASTLTRLVR